MAVENPAIPALSVGAVRAVAIDFWDAGDGPLDTGVLLTGTPLVVEQTTAHLTLTNKAVSTGALTINGQATVAGQAVQFMVDLTGGSVVAGQTYTLLVTCGNDATPAETYTELYRFTAC